MTPPGPDSEQDGIADEEASPLRALIDGVERARRLTGYTLLAALVGTAIGWNYAQRGFELLALPLTRELAARGQDPRLAFTGLTDPFILYFTVSLFCGLLVAIPFIGVQVLVALTPRLGRPAVGKTLAFILAASGLFLGGVAFCYFVLLPFGIAYLLDVGGEFETAITVREFLSFALRLMVALGFAAQLPLVCMVAARVGLVTAATLWRFFPYAVIVIFIAGAWLTPPDVISQLLVALPLLALYVIGILAAAVAARRR